MLSGFRDFILRGNVIELATAVIVGAAFTNVVTAISDRVINPLIAAVGSPDTPALQWTIRPGLEATTVDLGSVITALINFLIVAGVVYFIIIAPMNKLNDLRGKTDETPPTMEELLTEIRDLLQAQNAGQTGAPGIPGTTSPADGQGGTEPGSAPRH